MFIYLSIYFIIIIIILIYIVIIIIIILIYFQYKVDIDALKGFAYVRMFGNELGFWQFDDPNLSFFKNFDIKKMVKNEKIAFSKNMGLMDTQLIVPTIIGLPLNLSVAATASVDVEAMGNMNLASFKNIEFGGSIKPR